MKRWIVVNIGCIECGVSSAVVGLYGSAEEAEAVADKLGNSLSWREGGQNSFEVFDLKEPMREEYVKALGQ